MTELYPTYTLGDLVLTDYPYAVEFGGSHGAPESVSDVVESMLADGEVGGMTRYGNRELSLVIHVEGADLADLAVNEAALRAECRKAANELIFNPGDDFAPASSFEVGTIGMELLRNDVEEQHTLHRWQLTIPAQPFAASLDTTASSALSVAGSLSQATIDTCDTATGWSATRNGAPDNATTFWEAGTVGVAELDNAVTGPEVWTLTRTGSISFATMPYLVAQVSTISAQSDLGVSAVTSAGATLNLSIVSRRAVGSGYTDVVCLVPSGLTLASITFRHVSSAGEPWQGLFVRNVSQTNMPPGTSARQLTRLIEVGGTERTPASLQATTSSGVLGTTFLHTMPFDGSGYAPDMRRWRATGNTTTTNADTRKITGTWEPMKPNPVISRTPAHSLPRGGYVLMAAVKADTVGTHRIDWAVKSVTSGVVIGQTSDSKEWIFSTAHEMNFVPLAGDLSLPVVRSAALDVEVHLFNPSPTVALSVEEWWLFKVDDDCALTIVNTSEGNLWCDSPDVDSPVPLVWVGPNKPGAFHPGAGLIAQGQHTFLPGQVLVTSISDRNDYVDVALSYRKRWHSNAAE